MAVNIGPFQEIINVNWPPVGWSVLAQGLLTDERGWSSEDDPSGVLYRLRFNFEDSLNCGGNNDNVQSGTASRRFLANNDLYVNVFVTGLVERQNEDFDALNVFLDGTQILKARSIGEGNACEMGAPKIEFVAKRPFFIPGGTFFEISVSLSTIDNLFHVNAFYQMDFLFTDQPIFVDDEPDSA